MKNLLIIFAIIALFSCKKKDVDPDKKDLPYRALRFFVYQSDSIRLTSPTSIIIFSSKTHFDDFYAKKPNTPPPLYSSDSNPFVLDNHPPAGTYYIYGSNLRYNTTKEYYYNGKEWNTEVKIYLPKN